MPSNSIKHSQKKCTSCFGMLPATPAYFGSSRHSSDKLRPDCRKCVAWYRRQERRSRYTIENDPYAGEPIRHLPQHNAYILNLGFLRGQLVCYAHHTINHTQYDACISKEDSGRLAVTISNREGEVVFTVVERKLDMEQFIFEVGKALKARQIRLELTDVDLHRALKEIYFI